jgi:predicted MFS family arabinose efflux permease
VSLDRRDASAYEEAVPRSVEPRVAIVAPLRGRSFRLLLVATAGGFASFALLQPVAPLWAVLRGAGPVGGGAINGIFLLVTVLTQVCMPWLLRRVEHRVVLALGVLLVGAPAPLFAASTQMWALLGVSGLRGVGFGLLTVTGSALMAELVPAAHRGRAAGAYGLAAGLPNIVFLPAGVWLSQQVGFVPLFWIACGLPVAATAAVLGMSPVPERSDSDIATASADAPKFLLPSLVTATISAAAGGFVTFVPLAIVAAVAAPALLVFSIAMVIGRWLAGVIGDRMGARRVLLPSVLFVGFGMSAVAAAAAGPALLAPVGALCLGTGFGALQNVTLVMMFERAASRSASTAWNIAIDAGSGLGAVGFGLLINAAGYAAAFAVAAGVLLATAPLAVRLTR